MAEILLPDEVTRYDCGDIRENVIAVYTAGPIGEGVASIDVEYVKERPLPIGR